ncbi:MAG: SAF domain-containing protein [Arachnia sp.]
MKPLESLVRLITWHRRLSAALLAALSVFALGMWLKEAPEGTPVVTLAHGVTAGTKLTADDLRVARLPPDEVPAGAARSPNDVAGQVLGLSLPEGTAVIPELLADGIAEGRAVVPIRLADADLRTFLTHGRQISLILSDESGIHTVTDDATVVSQEAPPSDDSPLAGGAASEIVLVAVDPSVAPTVAALGQNGQLGVILAG